jgi:hypothetical protein
MHFTDRDRVGIRFSGDVIAYTVSCKAQQLNFSLNQTPRGVQATSPRWHLCLVRSYIKVDFCLISRAMGSITIKDVETAPFADSRVHLL